MECSGYKCRFGPCQCINQNGNICPTVQLFFFFCTDLSLDFWDVLYKSSCHVGELSLDEFIDGARRDKWVMKMLQMDVNPGDWLNDRRRSANF